MKALWNVLSEGPMDRNKGKIMGRKIPVAAVTPKERGDHTPFITPLTRYPISISLIMKEKSIPYRTRKILTNDPAAIPANVPTRPIPPASSTKSNLMLLLFIPRALTIPSSRVRS